MDFYWFLRGKKNNQNPNFHEKDVSLASKYLLQEKMEPFLFLSCLL